MMVVCADAIPSSSSSSMVVSPRPSEGESAEDGWAVGLPGVAMCKSCSFWLYPNEPSSCAVEPSPLVMTDMAADVGGAFFCEPALKGREEGRSSAELLACWLSHG